MLATPIGNLADISVRGLAALARADAIAAEDTRSAQRLLQAYGIAGKPLVRCDMHAEQQAAAALAARLAQGARVVLISDAGTPAVSDPGARLVDALRAQGHRIVPLPGASAPLALLAAAGFDERRGFRFLGFAPRKPGERAAFVDALGRSGEHAVFFESPQRMPALLAALAHGLPAARRVALGRELTKRFEHIEVVDAGALAAWAATLGPQLQQGEWVLAVEAAVAAADDAPSALSEHDRRWLDALAQQLPPSTAAQIAAAATGRPRQQLYRALLGGRADETPMAGEAQQKLGASIQKK